MSKLAKQIAASPITTTARRAKPGPDNCCFPLYGEGDLEDWNAVESLRPGREWRDVQARVDELAGIEKSLPLGKFRYHWRRKCYCWPEDLRR